MIDLWYKDAVIYSLDVETFQDSNGDGIGDFRGLTERLDYLSSLGVTCLWLLPIYPTPNLDNGYDVQDYYAVDPRLGTLGDFVELMHQARERGIRVLLDLVVNHSSNQHPWFLAARQSRDSPYRDFYVWSDTLPANANVGMVFPGYQDAVWTWDDAAGAYYFHRFYAHQPDLNISNPRVREEICRIMGFWLELGVSGFRLDAAPFLIEMKGADSAPGEDQYAYLREFRDFLSWRRGDAILLAEANVEGGKAAQYFGDGVRLHMLFSFLVNQHYFLALARQEAEPLIRGIGLLPRLPPTGQWANFVRNHDELDLGRLSKEEREGIFRLFAPDPGMQLYERGIRRRLPPMLGGDRRRIELAYSLMLSLPGTPVLRYGEEIGMGDDLSLPERESVRTVMQWSRERNAGFSTAAELLRPAIADGPFGYRAGVDVDDQHRDPKSLLHWMGRLITTRKQCPELGWGACEVLETGDPAVFALRCDWSGASLVTVHNLADRPATVRLAALEDERRQIVELLADTPEANVDGREPIELEPFGYRWYRIGGVRRFLL